jgi:hypothetical protein
MRATTEVRECVSAEVREWDAVAPRFGITLAARVRLVADAQVRGTPHASAADFVML